MGESLRVSRFLTLHPTSASCKVLGYFGSAVVSTPCHPPIGIGSCDDCKGPTPEVGVVVFEAGVLDVHGSGIQLQHSAPVLSSVVAKKLRVRDGEICPLNKQPCPRVRWHGKESSASEGNSTIYDVSMYCVV